MNVSVLPIEFYVIGKMLKKSKTPQEMQFWFRHLFGPQDTIKFGTHYDAFDVEKLKWMFSVVGFTKYTHEVTGRWPNIQFTAIKEDHCLKSDEAAERDIIRYMANYETQDEIGRAFSAWMKAMNISSNKPKTPTFYTHELFKNQGILPKLKCKIARILKW